MSPATTPTKDKGKTEKRKKDTEEGTKQDSATPVKLTKHDPEKSKKTHEIKKITTTTSDAPKPAPVIKKVVKEVKKIDIYQEVSNMELTESKERDRNEDIAIFKEALADVRKKLDHVYKIRLSGKSEAEQDQLDQIRMECGLLFVKMKKLNRLEKLRLRTARENTNAAKQKVDQFNLQLQNLRYEVLHLKKEVNRCINFWSADEDVNLIPVNDFYAEAPKDISKPEVTKDDPHQLKLARLVWELKTRKKLHAKANEVEEARNKEEAVVNLKDDKVKELGKHLKNMLKMTKPVQESLNLPLDEERKRGRLQTLLAAPLQYLATCAQTYINTDSLCTWDIEGEEKVAKNWRAEADEGDDGAQHPLKVVLEVKTKRGDKIDLVFSYLFKTNIVVLKGRIKPTNPTYTGEVLEVVNILNNFYNEEGGSESAEAQQFESWASEKLGKAREDLITFSWVNKFAGIQQDGRKVNQKDCMQLMSSVVQALRTRLESRVSLQEQLNLLAQGKSLKQESWPLQVVQKYPLKIGSKLKSVDSYSWEQFCLHGEHSSLIKDGIIHSNDFLFKCVVTRGIATLTGLVAIKADYPSTAPIFILTLAWKERWNSSNNEWIRDLESEINSQVEDVSNDIFIHQIYKLQVLMDVMLECISSLDDQPVFTKHHNFQVPVDGRQRKLPFLYDPVENFFTVRN